LSIVIPSHRRADLLTACLQSLQIHTPENVEIIVVDDASENAIIARTALGFPNVRVVRLVRPSGFCIAANAGIASATAPIIEMLNDDTEVNAGWAEAALSCFADPKVVAVAPLVLQLDDARRDDPLIDSAGDEYDPGGYASKRWHGVARSELPARGDEFPTRRQKERGRFGSVDSTTSWKLVATSAESVNEPQPVWGASASAAFYRRDALLAAGGFPADFGAYFEDVDLSHRLNRTGGVTLFQPASVVWHRVSSSYGRSPSREGLVRQSRNEERVFWRNAARIEHLPRHAAVLAGKAVRRLREGTFRPWMQGRLEAWLG